MDLANLRAHPALLPTFLTHQRIRETPVSGGDTCLARRLTLDDGNSIFVKSASERAGTPLPEGFFAAEAAGLRWLAEPAAIGVPEVLIALPDLLALEWVEAGAPSPVSAERFGRELAALHRAGAPEFGAPWPGFIGRLPQDNTPSAGPWAEWFAECRLVPHLRRAADRQALSPTDVALVEQLISALPGYGGDEPPARIHGDLWPGNVLWGVGHRAWLVDPAAHGGHRETDLGDLQLFGGLPYADRALAAYQEVWPLADGWQARRPVHQLHLLLVHAALFGAAYRGAVVDAVGAALAGR